MVDLRVRPRLHTRYRDFVESQRITLASGPFIAATDKVCTIGSCFARESRFALRDLGMAVSPHYAEAVFDADEVRIDNLPREEHLNFYNAFTVLQEIERAFGLWTQEPDDHWVLSSARYWPGETIYQDPYRRLILGRTPAALRGALGQIDRILREAILSADAFLITYGMTEVYRNRRNGRVVAQKPLYGGGGGADETDYWQSSFEDNLRAIRRTVDLLLAHNANIRLFMTVSPVALERTFSGNDIFVANSESKATLRAVLAQIARDYQSVTYFPAYEAVMAGGAASFRDDGRHVLVPVVQAIMRGFVAAHVQQEEARRPAEPASR